MIYFIQAGEGGPVKIGHGEDPEARRKALQTGNPAELRIIGTHPGGAREEEMVHAALAEWRIRGEWFEPDEVVLSAAKHLDEIMEVLWGPWTEARWVREGLMDRECRLTREGLDYALGLESRAFIVGDWWVKGVRDDLGLRQFPRLEMGEPEAQEVQHDSEPSGGA